MVETEKDYFKELIKESSLTSVLPRVESNRLGPLMFKVSVLVVTTSGCLYQVGAFLELFFQYPSITDIEISYPTTVPFPAITVCNANVLKRIKTCELEEEICQMSPRGEEFCEENPEICENPNISNYYKMIIPDNYIFEKVNSLEKLHIFGHSSEDLIKSCYASWAPQDDFCKRERLDWIIAVDIFNIRRNCFVINSRKKLEKFPAQDIPLSTSHYLQIILDLQPEETFQPRRRVTAFTIPYTPYEYPIPYREALLILPGKKYTITLKPILNKLLKAPFASNCTDYLSQRDDEDQPMSQKTCSVQCIRELAKQTCNCAPVHLSYPVDKEDLNASFCILGHMGSQECSVQVDITPCLSRCSKDCSYYSYEWSVSESVFDNPPKYTGYHDPEFTTNNTGMTIDEIEPYMFPEPEPSIPYTSLFNKDRYVKLEFKLKKAELIEYTQKPKYVSIEIFRYIGGYLGMWLGICLLAGFEVLEIGFLVARHRLRGRRASHHTARQQDGKAVTVKEHGYTPPVKLLADIVN